MMVVVEKVVVEEVMVVVVAVVAASQSFIHISCFYSFKFPYSNFELAIQKLKHEKSKSREITQVFAAADYNHTKVVPYNTFR